MAPLLRSPPLICGSEAVDARFESPLTGRKPYSVPALPSMTAATYANHEQVNTSAADRRYGQ
jgi:hypothetical protein